MTSHIARIEVYSDYNEDGSMNLELAFSYGCPELDLMGYTNVLSLLEAIRKKLKEDTQPTTKGCGELFERDIYEGITSKLICGKLEGGKKYYCDKCQEDRLHVPDQICECKHLIDLHIEQVNGKAIAGECRKCDCQKYREQDGGKND